MIAKLPWRLWAAQVMAILRLEIAKNFKRKRAIPVYLLALMPFVLWQAHSFAYMRGWRHCDGHEDIMVFAGVFQVFVLRLAIFFSSVAIFMNLFRGEVMEKTLHYYFLAPVRREVLVVGKYLSGLAMMVILFTASTALSYLTAVSHLKLTASRAAAANAMGDLPAYLGVTMLACLGYGAVFLIMGLLFRNPIVPTAAILTWESIIVFLPAILKKFSVIFYLESLCPVRLPFTGPGMLFAITADPTPAYLAVPGLIALTLLVLVAASFCIRRMEVRYGTE
jgi:ABC-type transport system involved in multi-copper enzyme maturation permease subunit